MNITSLIIGACSFLIIGIFHPIVIKGEYYFSKKIWPIFLVLGLIFLGVAVFVNNILISSILSITGFTCLWSIHELFAQEKRVKKGWFPKNPNRKDG